MELTLAEENLLLAFDSAEATEADFDAVQCLTSKHLLLCVCESPYKWVLSNEGQSAKEAIQAERTRYDREEERYRESDLREEKKIKLGVYGFYISLASLLVALAAFICSLY